jgi:hypothetical protein
LQPDRLVIRKSDPTEVRRQIDVCLARLDDYTESGNHHRRMKLERWSEFFEILLPYVKNEPVVLYFEELHWLANYRDDFLSEFKPFWDDITSEPASETLAAEGFFTYLITAEELFAQARSRL